MNIETAHVQTVTATVHVVLVGNRQLTKTMVDQLDVWPADELEPWGRLGYLPRKFSRRICPPAFAVLGVVDDGSLGIAAAIGFGDCGCARYRGFPDAPNVVIAHCSCQLECLPLLVMAGLR